MIGLVIPVRSKLCDLKKILTSVLLQTCNEQIKVLLCFDDNEIMNCFNDVIDIFKERLKIEIIISNNLCYDYNTLKLCDCKYVMFLNDGDFFYDAFSVQKLYKELICNNDYDFVYGNSVGLSGKYDYFAIDNRYLSLTGKMFNIDYLKKNNIVLNMEKNIDIGFVSKCFLLTNKYLHVDSVVSVYGFDELYLLDNLNNVVSIIADIYNLLKTKVSSNVMKNYIYENIDYLNKVFRNNADTLVFEEFCKIILPLEKVYRELVKEV